MPEICDSMLEIAKRIKDRRESLGYSYQDLANITGMSKSTLQRYENGGIKNVPLSRLDTLAVALQTTPSFLMGWEKQKETPAPERTAAEEHSDLKRRTAFYRALVTLGYLQEGEDIPDDRLEIAIHALQILDLAFRRADHAVDDVAHAG